MGYGLIKTTMPKEKPKGSRLNLRISDAVMADLESLAEYFALPPSSLAHSYLVRAIRREKEKNPEAFPGVPREGVREGVPVATDAADPIPLIDGGAQKRRRTG